MQVHARYADLNAPEPKIQPIDVDVWEKNPDKPGYLRFVRMRTVGEIFDELKARLKQDDLLPDEYFNISQPEWTECNYKNERDIEIPDGFWRIIAFATPGTSEGHYIHVSLIKKGKIYNMFTGKTLREGEDGMDYALNIANVCAKHLSC